MKWKIFSTSVVLAAALALVSDVDARPRRSRSRDSHTQHKDSGVGKGQSYGKADHEMNMGYSAPGRIDCTGAWDVFVSGSFIYWHVSQEQMDVAVVQDTSTPPVTQMVEQRFKYKPGFKVALGTNFGHDNWMGMVEYTRLHMSTTVRSGPPGAGTANPGNLRGVDGFFDNGVADQLADRITAKWRVKLDVLDGELSRPYYSGRMLVVSPFVGPRGGWLKQRENTTAILQNQTQPVIPARVRSSSWFVGPRAGADLKWQLGWGFRFSTNFAGSLLYQRQKVRARYFDPSDGTTETLRLRRTYRLVRPNAELGLGLAWGSYFMDNSWHFDLSAAYEFHYWWGQNVLKQATVENFYSNMNKSTSITPGDLAMHGLTLTLRLDF